MTSTGTNRALAAFEDAVRHHFANPPETWTVRKVADRYWAVVDQDGNTIETTSTKKAADAARTAGRYVTYWHERSAWYRGTDTDPRSRELTPDERSVVATVFAENGEPPADAQTWALVVFHEEDARDCGDVEPDVTLCASYDTAIEVLRHAFEDELDDAEERVADDDLTHWLYTRWGVHASITRPYVERRPADPDVRAAPTEGTHSGFRE
jgi:hypothetical protein